MKHLIKLPDQDSIEFAEYKSFYSSLVEVRRNELKEKFPDFLETINNLDEVYKFRAYDDFIDSIIKHGLLDTYLPHIESQFLAYQNIEQNSSEKSLALYYLYNVALKTGLIKKHFPFFLESIERLTNEFPLPSDSVFGIYKAAYEMGLLEKYFAKFFKAVDNLSNYAKYHAFAQLINIAVESRLFKKYIPAFKKRLDTLPDEYKHRGTYQLIDNIRDAKLVRKHPTQIKTLTVNLLDKFEQVPFVLKYRTFTELLELMKINTGLLNNHFSDLMEIIEKYIGNQKYHALYNLIDLIKKTGHIDKYYVEIKNRFFFFIEDLEKFVNLNEYDAIHALLKLEEGTGLIADYTPIILEMIKKMPYYYSASEEAYSELLEVLKKTGMKQEHFPIFLEILDTYVIPSNYHAFCSLLEAANVNDLIKENFISLLERIKDFKEIHKYNAFHEFIKVIKHTDLMIKYEMNIVGIFQSLLKDFETLPDYEQYQGFIKLLEIAEELKLKEKFLQEILAILPRLPEIDSLDGCAREEIYDNFIDEIENASLDNLQVFKIWKGKNQHFKKDECF